MRQEIIKPIAMNNLALFALLFSLLTFTSAPVFAQNQKKAIRAHKGHHHGGTRKFHRNKVVVVHKRRGRVIHVLPAGHVVHVHRGRNYYFHDGFYYNNVGNTYTLVPAPFGLRIKALPPNHRKIIVVGKPYFYSSGTYYSASNNEYEVVEPMVGSVVPDLPQDNVEEITIDGEKLYEYDGYLYKALSDNQFELIGKIES